MASINDLITATESGGPPQPTTVTSIRSSGGTTLAVGALTDWPYNGALGADSAVHFVTGTPEIDAEGNQIINPATLCLWKGVIAGAGSTQITNIVLRYSATGSDPGNSIGDIVEMAPTSSWAQDLFQALTLEHSTTGAHLSTDTEIWNPAGMYVPFAGSTVPAGWLLCDGSAVSRTTYANLFAAIGTLYGNGDGSTTFNVPNLKDRIPVGYDASDANFNALGKTGGEETHVLTVNEMPSHNHNDNGHTHGGASGYQFVMNAGGGAVGYANGSSGLNASSVTAVGYASITNTGGGAAHNNLQPYITANYIIKT